jgi:hypothetical protein
MIKSLLKFNTLLFALFLINPLAQAQDKAKPLQGINLKVDVFPNPSPSRVFSVVIEATQSKKIEVQVWDAFQRVVYQKQMRPIYGVSLHTLRLDTRPKGWYYLAIITPEGKIIKRLESM